MTQADFALAYGAIQTAKAAPATRPVWRDFQAGCAAMDRIRNGMSRGLAIHKTADEYGITVKRLASYLSSRRQHKPLPKVEEHWWDK